VGIMKVVRGGGGGGREGDMITIMMIEMMRTREMTIVEVETGR